MVDRTIALVYVRKSFVKAGGPDPASPEMQAQACERAAKEIGLEPELYVDAKGHLSGKSEDRPAWQTLRQRLRDPRVAAVVVYTWNRAVRNAKLLLALVDELDELGVRFVAVQNNIDTSTAAGRFQLTVMAAADEYESNVASERRVETIDHLRRVKGRHYGLPPFGTERKPSDGDLVLFASEKGQTNGTDHAVLTQVYELYGGGNETIYTLARRLNQEGWLYRDRHGALRPWTVDDVRRILSNYWVYAGYVPIGKGREREVIRGSHAAILPERLTTPVAARLSQHPSGWKRRKPYIYSLSGLIFCECGQVLRGNIHNQQRCYRHYAGCALKRPYEYDAAGLEAQVRQRIANISIPQALLRRSDQDLMRLLAREQPGKNAQIERQRIEQSIERLADLYADGEITREIYDRKKSDYLAQMPQALEDITEPQEAFVLLASVRDSVHDAGAAVFSDMANALYERIIITEGGALKYQARTWCLEWIEVA